MGIDGNGKDMFTSPGSETMACLTWGIHGNPGDPAFLPIREYAGQPKREEGK